jgi:hypothetical protein
MTMNKRALVTDRERRLVEGPGGIMEMKQTIANKEAEIEELKRLNDNANKFSEKVAADVLDKLYHENQIEKRYREFVLAFHNEPMEMSYEKIALQMGYWKSNAAAVIDEVERDK